MAKWLGARVTLLRGARVVVTGGAGFLGKAVCRELEARGVREIVVPRSANYDLTEQHSVRQLFSESRPDIVIHLAAEVGGIGANQSNPGRFFYANMAMGLNLIEEARKSSIPKFVQVGTVCSYPKFASVPFQEEELWNGYPEETNAPYGIAKKALLTMLEAYERQYGMEAIYLIPVNLYGPEDDFDPQSSHVIPALIRKFIEARDTERDSVEVWGTGAASREFLFVDDAARAIVMATEELADLTPVNLGSGREVTIRQLAQLIGERSGFAGNIEWDRSRPDGQPRRLLDTSKAEKLFGFKALVDLEEGIERTISWWEGQRALASGQTRSS